MIKICNFSTCRLQQKLQDYNVHAYVSLKLQCFNINRNSTRSTVVLHVIFSSKIIFRNINLKKNLSEDIQVGSNETLRVHVMAVLCIRIYVCTFTHSYLQTQTRELSLMRAACTKNDGKRVLPVSA